MAEGMPYNVANLALALIIVATRQVRSKMLCNPLVHGSSDLDLCYK